MAFFGTLFGYLNFSLLIFLGLGPAARWCVEESSEPLQHLFLVQTPRVSGTFPGMRMHACRMHMSHVCMRVIFSCFGQTSSTALSSDVHVLLLAVPPKP